MNYKFHEEWNVWELEQEDNGNLRSYTSYIYSFDKDNNLINKLLYLYGDEILEYFGSSDLRALYVKGNNPIVVGLKGSLLVMSSNEYFDILKFLPTVRNDFESVQGIETYNAHTGRLVTHVSSLYNSNNLYTLTRSNKINMFVYENLKAKYFDGMVITREDFSLEFLNGVLFKYYGNIELRLL